MRSPAPRRSTPCRCASGGTLTAIGLATTPRSATTRSSPPRSSTPTPTSPRRECSESSPTRPRSPASRSRWPSAATSTPTRWRTPSTRCGPTTWSSRTSSTTGCSARSRRRSTCWCGTRTARGCRPRCTRSTCARATSTTSSPRGEFEVDGHKLDPGRGRRRHLRAVGRRRPHRPVGLRATRPPSCSAATTGSCSAPPGTSPGSSTRRARRRSTGPTTAAPGGPAGVEGRRAAAGAAPGGRTGPRGSPSRAGPWSTAPRQPRQRRTPADRACAGQLRPRTRVTVARPTPFKGRIGAPPQRRYRATFVVLAVAVASFALLQSLVVPVLAHNGAASSTQIEDHYVGAHGVPAVRLDLYAAPRPPRGRRRQEADARRRSCACSRRLPDGRTGSERGWLIIARVVQGVGRRCTSFVVRHHPRRVPREKVDGGLSIIGVSGRGWVRRWHRGGRADSRPARLPLAVLAADGRDRARGAGGPDRGARVSCTHAGAAAGAPGVSAVRLAGRAAARAQ